MTADQRRFKFTRIRRDIRDTSDKFPEKISKVYSKLVEERDFDSSKETLTEYEDRFYNELDKFNTLLKELLKQIKKPEL